MSGVKDRLGDLSWLGIDDKCWVEVDVPDHIVVSNYKQVIDDQIKQILEESVTSISTPNITKEQFAKWSNYRKLIQEIPLQVGYPNNVQWPAKPE